MNRRSLFRTLVAAPLAAVAAKVGLAKKKPVDVSGSEELMDWYNKRLNESAVGTHYHGWTIYSIRDQESLLLGDPQKFTGKFIREK